MLRLQRSVGFPPWQVFQKKQHAVDFFGSWLLFADIKINY